MAVTQRINRINPLADLRTWELGALALASFVFALMTYLLVTDFSLRRSLWPTIGEGNLARPIGKVVSVLGRGLRQAQDQPEFVDLTVGDPVYPMDTVMAGPESALKITLNDRSVVEVGDNSMIRLNFDARLQLSGIDRQTVVEVVTGTVAARGGEKADLQIKSLAHQGKTFTATGDKGIQLSARGAEFNSREGGAQFDLVAQTRARIAETQRLAGAGGSAAAVNRTTTLGGSAAAVPANGLGAAGEAAKPSGESGAVSEIVRKLQAKAAAAKPTNALGLAMTASEKGKIEVALNTKVAEDMLASKPGARVKARVELAKAIAISPADNYTLKRPGAAAGATFAIPMRWKAVPEDAVYTVKIAKLGAPEASGQVLTVKARDGEVKFTPVLKEAGDYVWKIEDHGGAVISMRRMHINSKFKSIELMAPVIIGREKGSKVWTGADATWGFEFKWTAPAGVQKYKIKIARNLAGAGAGAGAMAEHEQTETRFILPFKKEWQAEKMFFSVEAISADGAPMASDNVPFMFTFLPPKPRAPLDKKVLSRDKLNDGALDFVWESASDVDHFTLEIAKDPTFKQKIDGDQVSDKTFRWYPKDTGRIYWRVRGDKDNLSSPYSETWEFTLH